jgi:hypothetical protein
MLVAAFFLNHRHWQPVLEMADEMPSCFTAA